MNIKKKEFVLLIEIIFLFFLVSLILIPISPLILSHSFRDSGVFLYSGWRIINGEIPYLHFWDHKPPIIFFINALGLLISGNSVWGVWILEFLAIFISALFGYKLIKNMFGIFPAMIGTMMWLLSFFFIIDGGNFTSEYALPFQFLTFYIISKSCNPRNIFKTFFLIGIFGGITFFLKQTSIGIWFAIIIYFLVKNFFINKRKEFFTKTLALFSGSLLVIFVIFSYFLINNAFFDFLDSVFIYNYFYTIEIINFHERFWNLLKFSQLSYSGLLQFGFIGIPLSFVFLKSKYVDSTVNTRGIIFLTLIDLPIELFLINLPGKSFSHYYITLLPTLTILSTLTIFIIDTWIKRQEINKKFITLVYFLSIILILLISIKEFRMHLNYFQSNQKTSIITFIKNNSDSRDYVLLWGAEASVNFYSRRVSPSKYFYQYPLFKPGYTNDKMVEEFLDDILLKKPKYIIDSNREEYPFFVFPNENNKINKNVEKIKSNYRIIGIIDDWSIYECVDK